MLAFSHRHNRNLNSRNSNDFACPLPVNSRQISSPYEFSNLGKQEPATFVHRNQITAIRQQSVVEIIGERKKCAKKYLLKNKAILILSNNLLLV